MKISARNKLKGKIVEIKKGATTAHVRIDVGGQTVTAAITNEATDELKLAPGQTVYAVIKASDVMVGIDRCRSKPSLAQIESRADNMKQPLQTRVESRESGEVIEQGSAIR